jgi:VWFA-related protein
MRTVTTAGAALLLALGVAGQAQQPQSQPQRGQQLQQPAGQQPQSQGQPQRGQQPQQPSEPQPPAPPPAADQQQQPPPIFRTGINFVRVDVIISDNKGNAVADLTQNDFEVSEDGKPQKIETFKLVKLDGGRSESIKEPPRPIRNDYDEEMEAARDDVRLFAIFLDDYHVRRGASLSVRNPLSTFIENSLGPSDMIGVMYPLESTASVRMTRNHSAVMRALQQFKGRKYDYEPRNQYEETYAHYPAEIVEKVRNQVSLSAIKALIVHMGSLKEGRKSIILVSEGYTSILPPQMRNADATMPGSGNPAYGNPLAGQNDPNEDRASWLASLDMDSDLREVYDAANRNNVAIYAVDPRGLPGFEFDINEGIGLQADQKYLNSTMDTLRLLSEQTDGRAIVNRNDLATGMAQITRDASAYYLIGYNSSEAPTDGKFHSIRVRVKRPGIQVRARKGYWAFTRDDAARAMAPPKPGPPKPVENAITAAVARPSRASVVRTWIGSSRGENGKTKVTFVWEPLPKMPGDPPREEPARVSLMAIAPDGSPYFRGKVPATVIGSTASGGGAPSAAAAASTMPATAAAKPVPQRVTFEAAPGKVQLRLSVEGAGSQVLDTETREITIPDLTGAQPLLGTPAVFRARTARDFQQLRAATDVVPTAGREFNRIEHLLIRVPTYGPGGTAPALKARLLNRAGQPMNDLQVEPSPVAGEQQVDLPLAALPPGEYVVEVRIGDGDGDAKELFAFRVTG